MRALALTIMLLIPITVGCLGSSGAADAPDVIATFYPLGFLAERIAGDTVRIGLLVSPGVEPHDFEPSVPDVARVGNAKVLLAQGRDFEPWLENLVAALGDRAPVVIDTTAAILDDPMHDEDLPPGEEDEDDHARDNDATAGHGDHDGLDPHTWLDPVLFAQQARAVEAALIAAFPEHAETFRARADALVANLTALHESFVAGLASCELRVIIASHDAFSHAARRYDFEVLAIAGLAPEAEPDPRTVARLVSAARDRGIRIVFFEELVSPRVAEIVAHEIRGETRVLSPIEGLTPEAAARGEDYVTLMKSNLAGLREAMRCV